MASNTAAWLKAAKSTPLEVGPAPSWSPGKGEILVRNKAVAINPVDGSLQALAWLPLEYPAILGQDVAGEVVEVGSGSPFKKGDRVIGQALGLSSKRQQDNAFQAYTILASHMASKIPDSMSFEDASVLPLGLSTAACGLFQPEPFLGLQFPTEPAQKPTGKTVLVWGGSSSVGSNAIQLAVAAGYEVIATASPKNFDYVKKLGALQVFDYNSPSIADDLIQAFDHGKECAGALDCIGGQAQDVCVQVVSKTSPGHGRVATTKAPVETLPEGVTSKRIFGTTLSENSVGPAIYEAFLPKALASGSFAPAPPSQVVGTGLEHVQSAIDKLMKGVSATKLVVKL